MLFLRRILFSASVAAVFLTAHNAWGAIQAIQDGDRVNISRPTSSYNGAANDLGHYADTDKAYGGALLGGEFRIVGPGAVSEAEVFKTFCLEYQEHISIPTTYYATIDSGAMGGGVGAVNGSDTLSNATKWFYYQYRTDQLSGKGGFAYDNPEWADALQLIFWRLEQEVQTDNWLLTNPNGGSIYGLSGAYGATVTANANSLWSYYTDLSRKSTIDGSDISGGRVQVINLWQTYSNGVGSGEKQSQLYMAPVPEPATLALWGIGLGIVGFVKLVRRKK